MHRKHKFFVLKVFLAVVLIAGLGLLSHSVQKAKLKSVALGVSPVSFTGQCPKTFAFTGKISVLTSGIVQYRWVKSTGQSKPPQTLTFKAPGVLTVKTTWSLGEDGKSYKKHWMILEVQGDKFMRSDKAYFSLDCTERTAVLRFPEISGRISAFMDGRNLAGRWVKVTCWRGGTRLFTQNHKLDSGGSCTYRFIRMLDDDYRITVEQLSDQDPDEYGSTANWCFEGTDPVDIRVTVGPAQRIHTNKNFTINYVLRWGGSGGEYCW